jgi:hypothetical protein
MADLSEYKQAIAEAFEGRAVRDAIVAMVQAVEDAINAEDAKISETETGLNDKITDLYHATDTIGHQIQSLDQRVTALEGG